MAVRWRLVLVVMAAAVPACDSGRLTNHGACDSDTDCEDQVGCTADACVDGECRNTPGACADDGLFCNGSEICAPSQAGADAATGCVSGGDPCTSFSMCRSGCNEGADNCFDPAGTACVDNDPGDCMQGACDGA